MADRMTGGLILPDYAQSMADGLQNYNQQQLAEQRQAEYARQQRMQANNDQARTQYANGDYNGARKTAQDGMNWETFDGLGADHQKQVVAQGIAVGSVAFDARQLQDPNQRVALFNSRRPQLKAAGLSDDDINGALPQLADNNFLDSYINAGQSLADKVKRQQETADADLKYQREQAKPITAQDGAVLVRGADGTLVPIYTPGTKPTQGEYKDADGNTHLYTTQGTPGTSYGPANMGAAQREVAGTLGNKLPQNVVAGFMGNFQVEGGYSGKKGDGGAAHGIAQWHPDRRANFTEATGKSWDQRTPTDEANFVVWEMQNPGRAGMTVAQRDAILNAKSPQEAAELIDRHYERSSGQHRQARIAAAGQYAGGGSAPSGNGVTQNGGVTDINLGGGQTGDGVRVETRTINGVEVQGEVQLRGDKRGSFTPYPGQTGANAGGKGKPPNDAQNKAASFATRMNRDNNTMQQLYQNGYNAADASSGIGRWVQGNVPFGNAITSAQTQQQEQSERSFLNAVLRRESGAAIGPSEFASGVKQYFPRYGDSPAVLAQKAAARTEAISNMRREAGPALSGGNGGGNLPRVSNQQQYNAIPSGSSYVDPTGKTRIKK